MKYSQELADEIVKSIEAGASNKDAATLNGVSEETFYKWSRENLADGTPNPEYHPEFPESLKKAETKRKVAMVNRVLTAASRSWQAAAWYLERRYNDEYGRKDSHEVLINPQDEFKRIVSRINKGELTEEKKEE